MATKNLITKIDGKFVHDASAFHGLTPGTNSYTIQYGDPASSFASTASLALPSNVALKSDISQVMAYKGTANSDASLPTGTNVSTGWVYVANGTWKSTYSDASIEPGDMFVYSGSTYNVIQTNIDPAKYAVKGHTHTLSIDSTTSTESITPEGSVTVTVNGATSTFTGSYTPAGSVTVNGTGALTTFSGDYTPSGSVTLTLSTASATATTSHDLSVTGGSHSHSFVGDQGSVSVSGTPNGVVSASLTTASSTASGSISGTASAHSHSFSTTATVSGSYTPAGNVTVTLGNPTLTTASVNYVSGASSTGSYKLLSSTAAGSAAISTWAYANEELTFTTASFIGSSDITEDAITVVNGLSTSSFTNVTGVSVAVSSASFAGTTASITLSGEVSGDTGTSTASISGLATVSYTEATGVSAGFTGSLSTYSGNFTPSGTISSTTPSIGISGDITVSYVQNTYTASFAGTAATISVSGTPLLDSLTGSFAGTTASITVSGTPQLGTPIATFSGTAFTHSHTVTVSGSTNA